MTTGATASLPKAVVLLSGGLDSAVCLAWAKAQGYDVHALSLRYGQRHGQELVCARYLAQALPVAAHLILDLDLCAMGGSALTTALPVPKEGVATTAIPVTYVPARNTVFLSLALAWAESLQAHDLVIGVNSVDFSGYPDCRPAFIEAFTHLANLGTREGVEGRDFHIHAPLQYLDKAQIVRLGLSLGVDFRHTHSCYDPQPDGAPCGGCDACRLRHQGFAQAGLADPALTAPG